MLPQQTWILMRSEHRLNINIIGTERLAHRRRRRHIHDSIQIFIFVFVLCDPFSNRRKCIAGTHYGAYGRRAPFVCVYVNYRIPDMTSTIKLHNAYIWYRPGGSVQFNRDRKP